MFDSVYGLDHEKTEFFIAKTETQYQRQCLCNADSAIPFPLKSKISSFYSSPLAAETYFCRTGSKNPMIKFVAAKHIWPVDRSSEVNYAGNKDNNKWAASYDRIFA